MSQNTIFKRRVEKKGVRGGGGGGAQEGEKGEGGEGVEEGNGREKEGYARGEKYSKIGGKRGMQMETGRDIDFFDRCKRCSRCGRPLPNDYRFDTCSACEEADLFDEVRDYIRSHDVNEIQVAEHFQISRRKIHAWIREGRIQYKTDDKSMMLNSCRSCGKQIPFGEYCKDCMRKGGGQIHLRQPNGSDGGSFRFKRY